VYWIRTELSSTLKMMLYKRFLSMALIGMTAHAVGAEEDITM
jgi:hypothetical protein